MSRKPGGKIPGSRNATALYAHATPVPNAINVYMLGYHGRSERQPRAKNGAPPHSTTTVASTASIQPAARLNDAVPTRPNKCGPIANANTGRVSAANSQNRRVIADNSSPLS